MSRRASDSRHEPSPRAARRARPALLVVPAPSFEALRHVAGVAVLLLVVLLAWDGQVTDLSVAKRAALQLVVGIWGMVAVITGLADRSRRPAVGLPLLVFAWALLPSLLRGVPTQHLVDTPVYFGILAMACALARRDLQRPATWIGLLWLMTAAAIALSISAIVEVIWLGGPAAFGGAPTATMGNPNHLGAGLILLMPAVLSCLVAGRGELRRSVVVVAALVLFAAGLTGSYLAVLGGAAVVGIAAALPALSGRQRIVLVAAMAVGLGAGHASYDAVHVSTDPALAEADAGQGSGLERAVSGRLYLFGRGAEVVASAPWIGVGAGEYAWAFARAQADHLEAQPGDVGLHTRLEHAHNDPLELVAEHGLVGIALILAMLWGVRRLARSRPLREPDDATTLRSAVVPVFALMGLALFALLSLGHFVLFTPQVAVIAVLYAACLPAWRVRLPVWGARALLAVALVALALASALALKSYRAERALVDGLQARVDGDLALAEVELERAQRELPSGRVLFHRGTVALERGRPEQAVDLLAAAAYLLPYAEVHHNYAVALCESGEVDAALQRFDLALRFDPRHEPSRRARAACIAATPGRQARASGSGRP